MNITLEKQNPTSARLRVQLAEADYAPGVEAQVKEYSKKAQIKGFRPGKVPAGMIRKMYGKSLLVDAINKLLHESVNNYIKDNKIRVNIFETINGGQTGFYFGEIQENGDLKFYEDSAIALAFPILVLKNYKSLENGGKESYWSKHKITGIENYKPDW